MFKVFMFDVDLKAWGVFPYSFAREEDAFNFMQECIKEDDAKHFNKVIYDYKIEKVA